MKNPAVFVTIATLCSSCVAIMTLYKSETFARRQNAVKPFLGMMMLTYLSGCTTYYSHYGKLTAENASGQTRDVIISWESRERPGWLGGTVTTPIILETQCSERVLVFKDAQDETRTCAQSKDGIFLCGDTARDLEQAGSQKVPAGMVCGEIRDEAGSTSISQLDTRVQLILHCWPAETEVQRGEEKVNLDYLRASPVPYQFTVKKVERGTLDDRKPPFDQKECKVN